MTPVERRVLVLTADLLMALQAPITPAAHDSLMWQLKEARHALDAEAFWAFTEART